MAYELNLTNDQYDAVYEINRAQNVISGLHTDIAMVRTFIGY